MKDSTLIQEEDSAGDEAMERRLKEYMGLFKDIDSEGDEEYAAYFTDGDDVLVYETHDNDKGNAEWVLNNVVCLYWLNKSIKKKVVEDADCDDRLFSAIRSAIAENYRRKDF